MNAIEDTILVSFSYLKLMGQAYHRRNHSHYVQERCKRPAATSNHFVNDPSNRYYMLADDNQGQKSHPRCEVCIIQLQAWCVGRYCNDNQGFKKKQPKPSSPYMRFIRSEHEVEL